MKIEVGEFVRTFNGIIKKVKEIELDKEYKENYYYYDEFFGVWKKNIVKHSKHIIDLIEVGDIVKVLVNKKTAEILTYTIDCEADLCLLREENLKEILTHEQFEQNCYRLEE